MRRAASPTPPLPPVPCLCSLITSDRKSYSLREDGILADVAPTALELMHIPQPEAMTGRTLRSIL
ncbi:MAG: hypothetical protein V9E95_00690 [Methanothrix soehngenii]